MNIIIVGCGRMGAELAYRLYQQDHHVVVVDQATDALDNLHPDFRGRVVEGDGLAQDVLQRAGIQEAEGLAAVTNSDTLNVVVGHVASTVYQVPHVVVRNYDARWQSLHEAFDLPVVSSTLRATRDIEALLQDIGLRPVFSLGDGEISLYELVVSASHHGHSLPDACSEDCCRVVALTRAGQTLLPSADFRLEAGDVLHVSATLAGLAALRARFNLPK